MLDYQLVIILLLLFLLYIKFKQMYNAFLQLI